MKKFFIAGLLTSTFFLSLIAIPVFAERNAGSRNEIKERLREGPEVETKIDDKKESIKVRIASRSALRQEKLEVKKLEVCETRQGNITRRASKLTDRADNQIKIFSAIAARVDTFYINKLLAKGKTLASYSALKADISSKEQTVKAALSVAKTDAKNFDCKGNDPKGQLKNFNADMRAVIIALQDYRTSIRNFIVSVKTAFNASKEASSSASL